MTSLIAWVAADPHGPTSIYIASDSRLSWSDSESWDTGRKLFASKQHADILGYCGDVLFPSQKLGQIIEHIDNGILINADMDISQKQQVVFDSIKNSFGDLPRKQRRNFDIIYSTRCNEEMSSNFGLCRISWTSQNGWSLVPIEIPNCSMLLDTLGTGKQSIESWMRKWARSDVKGTSRSIFSAFCDSLASGQDLRSGGAPQLVGIYRKGKSQSFGIVYQGGRYLLGDKVSSIEDLNSIEWRNELFERFDGNQLSLLPGAQPQPKPIQLSSNK